MTSSGRFLLCTAFVTAGLAQSITEFPLPAGSTPFGITALLAIAVRSTLSYSTEAGQV